jgi:hypothetical protein
MRFFSQLTIYQSEVGSRLTSGLITVLKPESEDPAFNVIPAGTSL